MITKETDMATPDKQRKSLMLRLKITVVSLVALVLSAACSPKPTQETPTITCYEPAVPTDTPEPIVTCYTATAPPPTFTPTPTVMCYTPTALPSTLTPTPTTFTSPLSPLPTPTLTPEARRLLRERLLAEGRFPHDVARELGS